ncbi:MAG: RNA 3'-terminal phosphate cyclase [Planctomycetota bacterium]|jgi:RNA 3'-terminal phosphate cyclase (ATP)
MLLLDGAAGEGGGQILRTALGLSLVTGTPFRLRNIRAGRERPGLRRQHLTAVEAAARVGASSVEGARLHSSRIDFVPGDVSGGDYTFDVRTAGSATLVLQTVLPALLLADTPSRLVLCGGTHNPFAPPFDFLVHVFLPWLRRMGATVEAELVRPGFFPAGGGEMRVDVQPVARLLPVDAMERGRVVARRATALVANLPLAIAERELHVVAKELGWRKKELHAEERSDATGPGNVLTLHIEAQHASEVVTGFGEKGVPAERVARRATRALKRHLAADVPVGEHLADQLLVPLALAGGGSFRTLPLSSHARTNAALIERFLPVRIDETTADAGACIVRITPRAAG